MRPAQLASLLVVAALSVTHPSLAQSREGGGDSGGGRKNEGPLMATGIVVGSLGAAVLFASGITWTVAAGEAAWLSSDCPQKRCIEGSSGASSLEKARDAEKAAGVLLGISLPLVTAGVVMLVYSGQIGGHQFRVAAAPSVSPTSAGAHVDVRF